MSKNKVTLSVICKIENFGIIFAMIVKGKMNGFAALDNHRKICDK